MKFLKNRYFIVFATILAIILAFLFIRNDDQAPHDFIVVEGRDVFQGVSVTGEVKPIESVDLSFNISGKIAATPVKVGDEVKSGQALIKLDQRDAQRDITDAKIDLEDARLTLEKLKREGTNSLIIKDKAQAQLAKSYEEAFNLLSDFFGSIPVEINDLEDAFEAQNGETDGNVDYYLKVVKIYHPRHVSEINRYEYSYNLTRYELEASFNDYLLIDRVSERARIDELLEETYLVAKNLAEFVRKSRDLTELYNQTLSDQGLTPNKVSKTSTENQLADLKSLSLKLDEYLISLFSSRQAIKDQKEEVIDVDLDIKKAELTVKQRESDLQAANNRFSDHSLLAPFAGIVVEVIGKVGARVVANEPVISLISLNLYEVEVNIPEADITKVEVGDKAKLYLDAYGPDVVFGAQVVSIEPAATEIDGVSTYKTTLNFSGNQKGIKSGMTADVEITGRSSLGVLSVPARAIVRRDGEQYVRVLSEENEVIEKKVKTGLRGSDGFVEVLQGLSAGDKVITFSR